MLVKIIYVSKNNNSKINLTQDPRYIVVNNL